MASYILIAEGVLIVIFVLLSDSLVHQPSSTHPLWFVCTLLFLLAAAMGLQTAGLTRIGPLTIHTTFVTGMLNKFAQAASQWIFWVHDQRGENASFLSVIRNSRDQPGFRNARLMAAIWVSYMTGAVAGTFMASRWSARALYLPVLILVGAVVVDQFRPLSIEEEKEQT